MNEKEFERRVARLERVAKVLEKLPAEARGEAMHLLSGFVTEPPSAPPVEPATTAGADEDLARSDEAFFDAFDHDKPSENAKLVAAWLYKEYGPEAFSLDEVRAVAEAAGVRLPVRVDMTFLQAVDGGKRLFARAGRCRFRPTAHGEATLAAAFRVRPGKKRRGGGGH